MSAPYCLQYTVPGAVAAESQATVARGACTGGARVGGPARVHSESRRTSRQPTRVRGRQRAAVSERALVPRRRSCRPCYIPLGAFRPSMLPHVPLLEAIRGKGAAQGSVLRRPLRTGANASRHAPAVDVLHLHVYHRAAAQPSLRQRHLEVVRLEAHVPRSRRRGQAGRHAMDLGHC